MFLARPRSELSLPRSHLPQVVLFPPGRKRRSIADWLLQVITIRTVTSPAVHIKAGEGNHAAGRGRSEIMAGISPMLSRISPRNQILGDVAKAVLEAPWCAFSDAVVAILQVFDAWLEVSSSPYYYRFYIISSKMLSLYLSNLT